MSPLRLLRFAVRAVLLLAVVILVAVGAGIGVIESSWGKDQIRALVVRQANQYLTARLAIGRLGGSLTSGLSLDNVTLSRDGQELVAIDSVVLTYALPELWRDGTTIRSLRLTRPRVVAARQADGRWDLGAMLKRDESQPARSLSRPIEIRAIEVVGASVLLRDPLAFGPAHVPTDFQSLNASMSFSSAPMGWTLTFGNVSWIGRAPDLTVTHLSGAIGRSAEGWAFNALSVQSPRSAFVLNGRVLSGEGPTVLDLSVKADRFSFQEWSGIVRPLENIAVDANFDTVLKGPVNSLDIGLTLAGTGGSVKGQIRFDTTVPGWHGTGAVDVARLNLARWLNRSDRPSDVTGHVAFNLDLGFGRHFPRGTYVFDGPHAMYMNYAGDNLHAHGRLTATQVVIDRATTFAYRANVTVTGGTIGIAAPFPFHFPGSMSDLDLRFVPPDLPVPHVESRLAFDYDVSGRFSMPFIVGHATFAASEFLDARIGAGMIGTINTETKPVQYSGDGDIQNLNLHRLGEGLDVGWLRDPRYAGTISGRFQVQGAGGDRATLALKASGRLSHADLFRGALSDADVSLDIDRGTLMAAFRGQVADVDPAIPFADSRMSASLTGSADVQVGVRDLLTRTPVLADYDASGRLMLVGSVLHGIPVDTAAIDATLAAGRLTFTRVDVAGPTIAGTGSGIVPLAAGDAFDLRYDVTRADLAELRSIIGVNATGLAITKGRLTGPTTALQAVGDASVSNLNAFGINALTMTGQYDVAIPTGGRPSGRVTASGSFMEIFGQSVQAIAGNVTIASDRADFDLTLTQAAIGTGQIAGAITIHPDEQQLDLLDLTLALGGAPWRLERAGSAPVLNWNDAGLAVTPTTLVTGTSGEERIGLSGTWRYDGAGALRVTATHVSLDTLENVQKQPARYGGIVDLDATIRGTRNAPLVSGTVSITNGRVERVTYEKLAGQVGYIQGALDIDVRLDQAPGIWFTAKGRVPMGLFDAKLPEGPLDVALISSPIDLGLLGGVTDVIRRASGQLRLDVHATGTSRDPLLDGTVDISNAAFVVAASGVPYKNGRAALRLSADRVTVESMHIEDEDGRALDVQGSLGTRRFQAGELAIDATARRFTVVDNEFGKIDVNADLRLRGEFELPRLAGSITINGNNLKVDRLLERTLFQPYATRQVTLGAVDAVAALNPWDRLGLDVFLRVPETLRLTGSDVQVSPGAPIGLGDINLRVGGDLYLYKDPREALQITGSFDSVSGTYTFQGRRFTIDETKSSINFLGDLDPNLFVTVTRVISGVETRVTISGSLRQPELRLASTPPLDESDILSLIVFNGTPNSLTGTQQQELAVRAGAIAAGFLAKPLLAAVENDLGLEAFQIEPTGEFGTGPRVTIGQELAPGLVARFSRQFGQHEFDEVTVEYYLSRLLRLRATFSDAQSIAAQAAFRRVERAGIDLLVFLSF